MTIQEVSKKITFCDKSSKVFLTLVFLEKEDLRSAITSAKAKIKALFQEEPVFLHSWHGFEGLTADSRYDVEDAFFFLELSRNVKIFSDSYIQEIFVFTRKAPKQHTYEMIRENYKKMGEVEYDLLQHFIETGHEHLLSKCFENHLSLSEAIFQLDERYIGSYSSFESFIREEAEFALKTDEKCRLNPCWILSAIDFQLAETILKDHFDIEVVYHGSEVSILWSERKFELETPDEEIPEDDF